MGASSRDIIYKRKKNLECHLIMGKICFIEERAQKTYKQLTEVCRVPGIRVQKTIRWATIKGSACLAKRKMVFWSVSEMLHCTHFLTLKAKERCKLLLKRKAIKEMTEWKVCCSSQVLLLSGMCKVNGFNSFVNCTTWICHYQQLNNEMC